MLERRVKAHRQSGTGADVTNILTFRPLLQPRHQLADHVEAQVPLLDRHELVRLARLTKVLRVIGSEEASRQLTERA